MVSFAALRAHLQNRTFYSLRLYPNFRLYWLGALTSNMGTWIQMVAQGWLVYDLTGSPLYLGIVSFASALPNLFLSLLGGVFADRFERRRLMVGTQTATMSLAFLLAYLTLAHIVTVWHIIVIAFVNGIVFSLNTPVRQTIISDLVPRKDLTNAIALGSFQFQASRMVGPALAGLIVALVGPGWCFFINGLSFLAVIWALLAMTVPPLPLAVRASVWRNLTAGLQYVRTSPLIMSLLGLAVVPSVFAMPYSALMPAFASSVLRVGAEGYGLLMSAAGLGAVLGALVVASLGKGASRGKLMLGAVAVLGVSLVVFALSSFFVVSLLVLIATGAASMAYSALNQTFLQLRTDDAMRGRVMSLLTLATFGLQPLGALAAGAVADVFGPSTAVLLGGLVCASFALWVAATNPAIRRLS